MYNITADEVARICKETLRKNTLPKVTTNFFSRLFKLQKFYTFNTYDVNTYNIHTSNDIARYYTVMWLSEQNDIPLQQAVDTAWYICKEVTMYLGPLMLLYNVSMSNDLISRLQSDYCAMNANKNVNVDKLIDATIEIIRLTSKTPINTLNKKYIHDEECEQEM